jgi:uncharacterized protein (DUF1501 family)
MSGLQLDRRGLLQSAGLWAAVRFLLPAGERREAAPPRLVWVQLAGGNDGLNTVVPREDDAYGRARPRLRLPPEELLPLDEHTALHGSLVGLHRLFQDGRLAVVHGVGYPDPNLSHFKSTDIWHTARAEGRLSGPGWLGRLAELRHGDQVLADRLVHVGRSLPYSLFSPRQPAVAFAAPRDYRYAKYGEEVGRVGGGDAAPAPSRLAFLRGVLHDAQLSSEAVRRAIAEHRPSRGFPDTALGASLAMVAALIDSELPCEVLTVELGGFDTHNDQLRRQRALLLELDGALHSFLEELAALPGAARTAVFVSSEFGRRVAENGSGGTDHGTAGPVFVGGPAVRGGQYGARPSLEDLDERGNLRHTVDFRRLYATVVEELFGERDSRSVLGERYEPLPLLG